MNLKYFLHVRNHINHQMSIAMGFFLFCVVLPLAILLGIPEMTNKDVENKLEISFYENKYKRFGLN